MASTTKIMTALVTIEGYDLDLKVTVTKESVGIEGSSIYLCEGEVLTLRQLVYALLLSSANDAATAIAIGTAGSVEAFAEKMNETAARLGLQNTHFDNPHGLDSETHYTTAEDLARLAAYAMQLPEFRKIVSTYKTYIPMGDNEKARLLVNHNKLLNMYDGAVGIKTGYTKKSGRCLVSAAEKDGILLIAVTLSAPDDWNDHIAMLNFGFDNYVSVDLTSDIQNLIVPVISGRVNSVICRPATKIEVTLPKGHGVISYRLEMKRFLYAPVSKGEEVGKIVFFCDGKEIASAVISSAHGAELAYQKYTIWDRLLDKIIK